MTHARADRDLVCITGVRSRLAYALRDLPEAMKDPYLAADAADRLHVAAGLIRRESTPGRELELLIWDAYRTTETQAAIYERCVQDLMSSDQLSHADAFVRARSFVASPAGLFPHGTGGAVDVTLLLNGRDAPMGTGFDEFVPASAPEWFRVHRPVSAEEQEAARNREVLRSAMERADFVGIDSEWWHFEWGTRHWAEVKREPVILGRSLPAPDVVDAANPQRVR